MCEKSFTWDDSFDRGRLKKPMHYLLHIGFNSLISYRLADNDAPGDMNLKLKT